MKRRMRKRILSAVLSAAMLLSSTPVYADVVVETADPEVGLCEHHTEHEDWCGYIAPTPGIPCAHEHEENCYSEVLTCGLEEDVIATDGNSTHVHDDQCYELEVDCQHEHDDECGYVEASAGVVCEFTCAECIALEELGGEGEGSSPWVINDRFQVGGLWYKELDPYNVQVYAVENSGDILIPKTVENDDGEEFYVVSIYGSAFEGNEDITSVEIQSEIFEIGAEMFKGCTNLKTVVLPNTVIDIGEGAFSGCESLEEITLPDNVTEIADSVFENCTALTSVEYTGVSSIGAKAFYGCNSLAQIDLSEVTEIGDYAFYNCYGFLEAYLEHCEDMEHSYSFEKRYDYEVGIPYPEYDCCKSYRLYLHSGLSIGEMALYLEPSDLNDEPTLIFTELAVDDMEVFDELGASIPEDVVFPIVNIAFAEGTNRYAVWLYPEDMNGTNPGAGEYNFTYTVDNWTGYFSIIDEDGSYGEIALNYIAYEDSGVLGESRDPAELVIPQELAYGGITYSVKEISDYFYENSADSWYWESVTIPYTVTYVGDSAFEGCESLMELCYDTDWHSANPDRVYIGDNAFKNCKGLLTAKLPAYTGLIGDNAFENCSDLYYVEVDCAYDSNIYLSIGWEAFKGCSNLTRVELPINTYEIGDYAFAGCKQLEYVGLLPADGASLERLAESSLSRVQNRTYTLVIRDYAFAGCENLESFYPDEAITEVILNKGVFEGCSGLKYVTLPKVESIPENAFKNCIKLSYFKINQSDYSSELYEIAASAFENCKSFPGFVFNRQYYDYSSGGSIDVNYGGHWKYSSGANIEDYSQALLILPESLMYLGARAFYGCESVKNIQWDFYVSESSEIGVEIFANCKDLIDVTFNNRPKFTNGMFKGCEKLQGLISPSLARTSDMNPIEVTPIESVFEDCKRLQFNGTDKYSPIRIASVDTIGARAFKNCQKLGPEWHIPNFVTEIGKEAFYGCKNLDTVYAFNSSLEYVGANAFPRGTKFVTNDDWIQLLLVEALDGETYAEAYWDGVDNVLPGAIVIVEDGLQIQGNVGEEAQVIIENGTTASIDSGETLTFEKDASLIVYGELEVNGKIKSLGGDGSEVILYVPNLSNVVFGDSAELEGKFKLVTNLTSSMISIDHTGTESTLAEGELKVSTVFGPENKLQTFVYNLNEDYTYSYPDNNPTFGTAKVVVTPTENGNLLGRARTKNFTIGKATPAVAVNPPTINKDDVTVTATVSGGVGSGYNGTMTIQVLQGEEVVLVKNVAVQMDETGTVAKATCSWSNLYNGTYAVEAIYNGDRYHTSATSVEEVTFTINVSGNNAPLGTGGSGGGGGGGGTGGGGGSSQSPAIPQPNANPNNSEPIDWGVITLDPVKGYVSSNYGIMARDNQDKHSGWKVDEISALIWGGNVDDYWQLQYPNGSVAKGSKSVDQNGNPVENYLWEQVNGKWWIFDSKGYAKMGWVYDPNYQAWFYIDVKNGMRTGWIQVNNLWYYLHEASDGRKGCMYAATRTPDGYYVNADGAWDGKAKQ